MERIAALVVRSTFGFFLGLFLAVLGFYAGWFSAPPGPTLPTSLLIVGTGIGAAAGGFIGWLKPESRKNLIGIHLGLALAGGLAGAWLGWELGPVIYPEGLYRPGSGFRAPPLFVAVAAATVTSNLFASVFYVFRLWRFRET